MLAFGLGALRCEERQGIEDGGGDEGGALGFGGVERWEVEDEVGTNFGETGIAGGEDWFAPLHGFDEGKAEAFALGGEEKCGAVCVEPTAGGVGDGADDADVARRGGEGAEMAGVGVGVVACDDEVVGWEVLHGGQ